MELNKTGHVYKWNKLECELKEKRSLAQIFADVCSKNHNKYAICSENRQITYGELEKITNRIAAMLHQKGIGQENIVGVIVERNIETISLILGIVKAGAAYMPIDKEVPLPRLEYVLRQSRPCCVINCSQTEIKILGYQIQNYHDIDFTQYEENDKTYPSTDRNLVYVIYTSGSTGQPKGVMTEVRGLIRLVRDSSYLPYCAEWNVLQSASLTFDASMIDVWGSLLNGAVLHIVEKQNLLDTEYLKRKIKECNINLMFLTTPLFHQLIDLDSTVLNGLDYLVVGGDILSSKHVKSFKSVNVATTLINAYGPTENSTVSTAYVVDDISQHNIPIGKPINNTTAYIIKGNGKIAEIGEYGELYVGGIGVARGYLENRKLTQEKFIPDPICGGKMYKTGDMARWLPDGNIEFIGRIDRQVKLRGYRVELGEIQQNLLSLKSIRECFVTISQKKGEKELVAYAVLATGATGDSIKENLRRILPEYMVPSYIVPVSQLPLTLSGKIDQKKLSHIYRHNVKMSTSHEADGEYVCTQIQDIVSKLLFTPVLANDNLYDCGFDSIKAIHLLSKLRKCGYQIQISDILKIRTVKELTEKISIDGGIREDEKRGQCKREN